jgi:hypothetical protein
LSFNVQRSTTFTHAFTASLAQVTSCISYTSGQCSSQTSLVRAHRRALALITDRLPADLELNCWVLGSRSGNVFKVKIAKEADIGDLKKIIKEEKPRSFQHVEADALDLWQVRVPVFRYTLLTVGL